MSTQHLVDADRGQRLSRGLPPFLQFLVRRYSDWNWGWRADIALRYVPVQEALQRSGLWDPVDGENADRSSDGACVLPILDVGCGSKGGLAAHVAVRTVGIDLRFNVPRIRRHPQVTPVVGSGLNLPIASHSCRVVLCMDTLEHLGPQERPALVRELFRVVVDGGLVVCGAPCGPEARAVEERLNAAYQARTGRAHPWLSEHLAHEPLTSESLRSLMVSGAWGRFARFDLDMVPNTNLALWERLQRERWLAHLHRPIYRLVWPLLRQQHDSPVYRQVCVVVGR